MTWHAGDERLDAYLRDGLDAVTAASLEAHLLSCGPCREAIARRTPAPAIQLSWAALERRIDSEPAAATDRFLIRFGLPESMVRLLVPTAPLRGAWLAAMTGALVAGALLTRGAGGSALGTAPYLVLAALVPLAAAAGALGSASEPAPEVAEIMPISRARVLGVRLTAALLVSLTLGLAASLILPGPWAQAALWMLPSLAMCAITTALSGRLGPARAAAGVGSVWLALVAVWTAQAGDQLAAFRPGPQLVYLALGAAVAAVIIARPGLLEPDRPMADFVNPWSTP